MTLPHLHRDYDREKVARVKHSEETKRFIQQRLTQREGKQLQHIYGSTEYNERVTRSTQPPSYFTISSDKIDSIVKAHVNMNKLGDRYQFVDAGKPIPLHSMVARLTLITTRMKVHQSRHGYAVPAKSKELLKDEDHTKH